MPYTQNEIEYLYPPIDAISWVVINRITETPVRIVADLSYVDMISEFALPFPTGNMPTKEVDRNADYQDEDDSGRPLYDDLSPDGTTVDVDSENDPYPPKIVSETITEEISLDESPELFTLTEVVEACASDFLSFYRFYNWAFITIFDDRVDTTPSFEDLSGASGLAAGSHPLFIGPIQGSWDAVSWTTTGDDPIPDPRPVGHLLLIAPPIQNVNWLYQIRHGVQGSGGGSGPVEDIAQASRLGEIYRLTPMENMVIPPTMILDSQLKEVQNFWIRTNDMALDGDFMDRSPSIPFIIILGRRDNDPESSNLGIPPTVVVG